MTIGLLFYQVCQIFAGFVVPLCRLEYVGKLDGDVVIICRCLVPASAAFVSVFAPLPPQAARLIAIVAASTTDNTFLIRFLSFFLTSPSHLSDRFINSFYYFLNKLPFQHLGKKIAPFLKNSLFQLFLTMAHLFVSAFGSLFIFYLILTLILRLGKLFCRNYIIFSRF